MNSNELPQEFISSEAKSDSDQGGPAQVKTTSQVNSKKTFKSSIAHKSNQVQDFLKQKEDSIINSPQSQLKVNRNLVSSEEWEILLIKLSEWTGISLPSSQSKWFVSPSILIMSFLALLFFIKAFLNFSSLFSVIPILPSIFEVFGAFWLTRFLIAHGLRKQDREKFIFEARERWKNFSDQAGEPPLK